MFLLRNAPLMLSGVILGIGLSVLALSYSEAQSAKPVNIAIATWPGFAVAYVARDRHFFTDLDVNIQIVDDPTARLAAFRGGYFDVDISSLDVFAEETAGGANGRIFSITDRSDGADGLVTRPDVKDLHDLLGHTIAVARGSPSQFLLHKLFQQQQLELNQVHLVFFQDPTLAGQAFISGKVDAAVTWEPLMSQIAREGKGKILASSADTPDAIIDALVGSEHFLSDGDVLHKFVDGWLKAVQFTKSNPEGAYPIIAKALGMGLQPGEDVMAGVALADLSQNERILCGAPGGKSLAETTLLDAQQFWVAAGVIPHAGPAPAHLIDPFICSR